MTTDIELETVQAIATAGYYIGLRVGYSFPQEQINTFPQPWVDHYTDKGLMPHDPIIRWMFGNTGTVRWSKLERDDPAGVFAQARSFGLCYGVTVSYYDGNPEKLRSFGSFVRDDREFEELEIQVLEIFLRKLHHERMPPRNLTAAELEVLVMVKDGQRLKDMAYSLSISEGAVKQRLKNARIKLGAKTGSEAAVRAASFGLI